MKDYRETREGGLRKREEGRNNIREREKGKKLKRDKKRTYMRLVNEGGEKDE